MKHLEARTPITRAHPRRQPTEHDAMQHQTAARLRVLQRLTQPA